MNCTSIILLGNRLNIVQTRFKPEGVNFPNRFFITGRAGENQKAKINLYRVQSALQGSPSASRDQVVSTEKIKAWIRFVCRATARTATSVTVCARSFAVYMSRIGALSRSLATADDRCCVAQRLYFLRISSLFTRLPDLSQNTPYYSTDYSTERTCLADKVGILHIKQKNPRTGPQAQTDPGIPFCFYFICTPSIARPRMPA